MTPPMATMVAVTPLFRKSANRVSRPTRNSSSTAPSSANTWTVSFTLIKLDAEQRGGQPSKCRRQQHAGEEFPDDGGDLEIFRYLSADLRREEQQTEREQCLKYKRIAG